MIYTHRWTDTSLLMVRGPDFPYSPALNQLVASLDRFIEEQSPVFYGEAAASRTLEVGRPAVGARLIPIVGLIVASAATAVIGFRLGHGPFPLSTTPIHAVAAVVWRPLLELGLFVCGSALAISVSRHLIEFAAAIRLIAELRKQ